MTLIPGSTRGLGSDALSLGHPGTRRTVYYTDDSPPPPPPPPSNLPVRVFYFPQSTLSFASYLSAIFQTLLCITLIFTY